MYTHDEIGDNVTLCVHLCLSVVAFLSLFFIPVQAEEWSRFRGDAQSTGVANSSLPAELDVLWTAQIEMGIESTAAIWQDAVYVGGVDEKLYVFDFDSGVLKWTYSATGEIKSSPLVFEKTVYFGDGNGVFHAVDAQTGKALWTFQTDGEIISSANATGGRILFGSYDQFLYCLAPDDGSLLWKIETDGYVHGMRLSHKRIH